MSTIIYLCYGSGLQIEETIFSIPCVRRFAPNWTGAWRLVVYTENPEAFAGLGIKIVTLDTTLDAARR
jgi:hypothetical protein